MTSTPTHPQNRGVFTEIRNCASAVTSGVLASHHDHVIAREGFRRSLELGRDVGRSPGLQRRDLRRLEREFPPGGFARGELDVLQLRRSGIDDLQVDTAGIARRDVGAQQPLGCSHLHLERPRDGDFECQFRGGGIGDGTHGDFIGSGLGIGRGRNFDGDILLAFASTCAEVACL